MEPFHSGGKQAISLGDCLQAMKAMEAGSVDVVVTSPPYNLGIEYGVYEDSLPRDTYLDWLDAVFRAIRRVMKPQGSLFLNLGSSSKDPWLAMDAAQVARRHFVLQNSIAWVKSISIGDESHGHFKPINSRRFLNNCWENLFHFSQSGDVPLDRLAIGVPFMDKSNIGRWKGNTRDRRCRGNCWHIPYETITRKVEKGDHPAIFPVELARWCILLHGINAETIVLDPFLGTGSTLVAAAELGVHGIGCEIDPEYAEYAARRMTGGE